MRLVALLAASALSVAGAVAQPTPLSPGASARALPPVVTASEDAALTEAIVEARRTFPGFAARLAAPRPGDEDFTVKVAIPYGDVHEHLWLGDLVLGRDSLRGTVRNASIYVPSLTVGRRLVAPRSAVTDWMFVEAGVLRGAYTTRVLLQRMSAPERRRMLADMGVRLD